MKCQMVRRLIFATIIVIAFAPSAVAQRAAILRPTKISKDSSELKLAPSLAGFQIGDSFDSAIARLAGPIKAEILGNGTDSPISCTNADSSISLFGGHGGVVGIIMVSTREAGALDGIRVGDSRDTVMKQWGSPAAGGDKQGLWLAGQYIISVKFDPNGYVSRLGIGFGQ